MALIAVATVLPDSDPQIIEEGSESAEFWRALGGFKDYNNEVDNPGAPLLEPRLFHCKIHKNGKLRVEEIHEFDQTDLDVDDIMILDGGDEVYIWQGKYSDKEEKERSVDMAKVLHTIFFLKYIQ